MAIEHRVAGLVGWHRDQDMRDPRERIRRERLGPVEHRSPALAVARGPGDGPSSEGEPARERLRAVAEAEAEQAVGHDRSSAGASSAWAMRGCLSQVMSQKPQETSAPSANGRRRPQRWLNAPISTAPKAGPARKIMP